ncbi:hypothetical protein AHiyo8_27400 [Arthrobacter sp. Hiyo8]|nr:hypothetical protein AHiyo8_27400 [Arthrobacter sp. Hiyo8]
MTGSALVTTRLSSVAMKTGREAATMASQTGMVRFMMTPRVAEVPLSWVVVIE